MTTIKDRFQDQDKFDEYIQKYLEEEFDWENDFIYEKINDSFIGCDIVYISKLIPSSSAKTGFKAVKVLGYNSTRRTLSFHLTDPASDYWAYFSSDIDSCIKLRKAPLSFIYLWNNLELKRSLSL